MRSMVLEERKLEEMKAEWESREKIELERLKIEKDRIAADAEDKKELRDLLKPLASQSKNKEPQN